MVYKVHLKKTNNSKDKGIIHTTPNLQVGGLKNSLASLYRSTIESESNINLQFMYC